MITKARDKAAVMFIILLVCFILPPLPSLASTSDITGMNVVLIELNMKLPTRVVADTAMKKASVSIPEPNFEAMRVSLINPRSLLPRVNIIIINADLAVLCDFFIHFYSYSISFTYYTNQLLFINY